MLEKMLRARGTLLALQATNPVPGAEIEAMAAPAWAVGAVGATVVLSGVLYFVWRARSARRASSSPGSVRPPAGKIR